MKKLTLMIGVIALAMGVQAAAVDWQVSGTAATENYNVYLLTSIADSYESVADIANAALISGTIAKNGRNYYATGNAVSDAITKDSMKEVYWVIVDGSGAPTSYNYVKTDMSAFVYDPDNQESSPGNFNSVTAADMLAGSSGSFGAVPEPTSGLLVLLGMAGLALKRKRA